MKKKAKPNTQVLYNKMILGELTLQEVMKLLGSKIHLIEVDNYEFTLWTWEKNELTVMEDEYDEEPYEFSGKSKVKITDEGVEVENHVLNFWVASPIDVMKALCPQGEKE